MELQLKRLRKLAGFTSAQKLADATGIKRGTIASWESGARDIPLDKAILICEVIDCTLDQLCGRAPIETLDGDFSAFTDAQKSELERYADYLKSRGEK